MDLGVAGSNPAASTNTLHTEDYSRLYLVILLLAFGQVALAQKPSSFRIGRLKYGEGGDWYVFPLEEPTLLKFISEHTNIRVEANFYPVKMSDNEMFSFPFLFLTGHGNVLFTKDD